MIFSSNVRIGQPLEIHGNDEFLSNPAISDIMGTILFDSEKFEVKYLNNRKKNKKFPGFFSGFFDLGLINIFKYTYNI